LLCSRNWVGCRRSDALLFGVTDFFGHLKHLQIPHNLKWLLAFALFPHSLHLISSIQVQVLELPYHEHLWLTSIGDGEVSGWFEDFKIVVLLVF